MRHLLGLEEAGRDDIESLLDDADGFVEVLDRPIPKVPALRGKTVATVFFEPSTRTRLSFERAAKALSADTLSFSPGTSSLSKGESLKDTVLTLRAIVHRAPRHLRVSIPPPLSAPCRRRVSPSGRACR